MTKEELAKKLKENQDKAQNEFIDKLLEMVEYLCEKANRKDYVPTEHEFRTFGLIVRIIKNMNEWF